MKDQFIRVKDQFPSIEKGNPRAYRATRKAHATLFQKKFQPMYLEQLVFVVKRAG